MNLPLETDRPPFNMVVLADPLFDGEVRAQRVIYRWARAANDPCYTYGDVQWAYPQPLWIMPSDAMYFSRPVPAGALYSLRIQPGLQWDACRPAPLPGQGLDEPGFQPPRTTGTHLSTYGSRQCLRRWQGREIRHVRLWPGNVERFLDLFFTSVARGELVFHRFLLRALLLLSAEPFVRQFQCGFLDWARGQVVLTQHRYYWAFLGMYPDGVWEDVFLHVDRHDNPADVAHHRAYLDVLLATRGTFQATGV
eukprot:jgi/Mesvir1/22766/Mv14158-RA.1